MNEDKRPNNIDHEYWPSHVTKFDIHHNCPKGNLFMAHNLRKWNENLWKIQNSAEEKGKNANPLIFIVELSEWGHRNKINKMSLC